MSQYELEELEPEHALKMYIEAREHELRDSTIKSVRSRLGMFVEYCENNEITSLSEINGIDIHKYRVEEADGIARRTLISRLSTVRTFLQWAESVEAVEPGFHEKIQIPTPESKRSRTLDSDRAETILEYLRRFEYASRDHIIIRLFWRTGVRLGSLRSVDVTDFYPNGNGDIDAPYVQLHHRPESDTPLKNGKHGERPLSLKEETGMLITSYLENNRIDATDDHGREPLLTTRNGRPGILTFRRTVYRYTRPCEIGKDCPHEKDPSDCEAAQNYDRASQCPSVVSPHDMRRGAITHFLRNDVPTPIVSDRCDVSPDVLDKHYDQRSDLEKMEQRRGYLENI